MLRKLAAPVSVFLRLRWVYNTKGVGWMGEAVGTAIRVGEANDSQFSNTLERRWKWLKLAQQTFLTESKGLCCSFGEQSFGSFNLGNALPLLNLKGFLVQNVSGPKRPLQQTLPSIQWLGLAYNSSSTVRYCTTRRTLSADMWTVVQIVGLQKT